MQDIPQRKAQSSTPHRRRWLTIRGQTVLTTRPNVCGANVPSVRAKRNKIRSDASQARLTHRWSVRTEVVKIHFKNALCPWDDQGSWPITNLTEAPVFRIPKISRG